MGYHSVLRFSQSYVITIGREYALCAHACGLRVCLPACALQTAGEPEVYGLISVLNLHRYAPLTNPDRPAPARIAPNCRIRCSSQSAPCRTERKLCNCHVWLCDPQLRLAARGALGPLSRVPIGIEITNASSRSARTSSHSALHVRRCLPAPKRYR